MSHPPDDACLRQALTRWVEGYVRAWTSNAPADIAALFTEDARYLPEPHAAPWEGRDEIVRRWLARRDEPGDAAFTWQPLVVTPGISIVQGATEYAGAGRSYSNLWAIRLVADGRCRAFTEWWMERDP